MNVKVFIWSCVLLLVSVAPVAAHEGEEHASDLELVVAGVGMIILTIGLLSLVVKVREEDEPPV